jgi:hypothetical protein
MWCVEKIWITWEEDMETHMCGGQPSLIPYLSLKGREGWH